MKKLFKLLSTEAPIWAETVVGSLLGIEFLFLILTAETLYDFMPKAAFAYLILAVIGLMYICKNDRNVHMKRKLHIDIRKIFFGITETSNIIEEEVIRRIKKEIGIVINNGASYSSISADLDRINFIASTKSMRLVEAYCKKASMATTLAYFDAL